LWPAGGVSVLRKNAKHAASRQEAPEPEKKELPNWGEQMDKRKFWIGAAWGWRFMRTTALSIAASLLVPCVLAGSALAQPLPAPASYPPVVGEKGVVAAHEISLDMAEKIARAGIEACRKMGFHTTMVVIDAGGTMKAFLRDDKTGPHTVTLAQDKAFTALTLASRFATSGTFATARNSTLGSPMSNIRGVTGVAGGVPVKYHGEVIGAVASSGAVGGANDEL
jgi:uncharacterized protein GlcG (DUF336 family)